MVHFIVCKMPLVCHELTSDELLIVNRELHEKPLTHPIRKESMDGRVDVFTQSGAVIFHSADGFHFRRVSGSLFETVLAEINMKREYLCSALEIDTLSAVPSILNRFTESHGLRLAAQIDHIIIEYGGKTLMLINLPSTVVRHMMAPMGGRLTTGFAGRVSDLRKIPTIFKYGNLQGSDTDMFRGCIGTEYKKDSYQYVREFHGAFLQEVISRPGLGITVMPLARWDA